MGSQNDTSTSSSTPTPAPVAPPKVDKYPHIKVIDGKVAFYAEVDGKIGNYVPRFAASNKNGQFVLENQSFDSEPLAIDDKNFAGKYGPMVLTSPVYLTLDDYRHNKSIPLADVKNALEQ